MGPSAQPLRILGGLVDATLAYLEFTTVNGTGVNTSVRALAGWSLGTFTAGVAALTFPKHYRGIILLGSGEDLRGTPTTEHIFDLRTPSVAAGTGVIVATDKLAGTEENPTTTTIRLCFLVFE